MGARCTQRPFRLGTELTDGVGVGVGVRAGTQQNKRGQQNNPEYVELNGEESTGMRTLPRVWQPNLFIPSQDPGP